MKPLVFYLSLVLLSCLSTFSHAKKSYVTIEITKENEASMDWSTATQEALESVDTLVINGITEEHAIALLSNCTNLKGLSLYHMEITPKIGELIREKTKTIQGLNISYPKNCSEKNIDLANLPHETKLSALILFNIPNKQELKRILTNLPKSVNKLDLFPKDADNPEIKEFLEPESINEQENQADNINKTKSRKTNYAYLCIGAAAAITTTLLLYYMYRLINRPSTHKQHTPSLQSLGQESQLLQSIHFSKLHTKN